MIIIEDKLRELFATLPPANYDGEEFPVIFDFGSEEDLNKFIRQEEKKYPLIWLQTGFYEDKKDPQTISSNISLILATYSGDVNKDNFQRLEDNFKKVLLPLLENIDKAFERSNIALFEDKNYRVTKFYNYGDGKEHGSTDIWDAIKYEVSINFYDNCFKAFNYG